MSACKSLITSYCLSSTTMSGSSGLKHSLSSPIAKESRSWTIGLPCTIWSLKRRLMMDNNDTKKELRQPKSWGSMNSLTCSGSGWLPSLVTRTNLIAFASWRCTWVNDSATSMKQTRPVPWPIFLSSPTRTSGWCSKARSKPVRRKKL